MGSRRESHDFTGFTVMRATSRAEEGIVKEALPNLTFRVVMRADETQEILAHLAGKMKLHNIRVLPGDRVLVELSPDGRRGRIVRRL